MSRWPDPLIRWLRNRKSMSAAPSPGSLEGMSRGMLDNLARALADKSGRKALPGVGHPGVVYGALADGDLRRAETLCREVFKRGGPGSGFAQVDMLELLGVTGSPESMPFWTEVLGWSRPRDALSATRRRLALAGMAHAACRSRSPACRDGLVDACVHPDPTVRGDAVWYLASLYFVRGLPLPDDVRARCLEVAAGDPAFVPRFLARRSLAESGPSAPANRPDGGCTLDVRLTGAARFKCRLAVRSSHTIEDLHHAIQDAYGWDADHCYELRLDGPRDDPRFVLGASRGDFDQDGERGWWPTLGELGLEVGDKFVYFFDFGDCHSFVVKVVGATAQADPYTHPFVVSRTGEPPEQYPDW